jgi:hypothetical protein
MTPQMIRIHFKITHRQRLVAEHFTTRVCGTVAHEAAVFRIAKREARRCASLPLGPGLIRQ